MSGTADSATLLSVAEMYRADALAAEGGVPSLDLMEAAGAAVADAVRALGEGPVTVLCGPGNNGGDGFVVARLLAADGRPVNVALLGEREALKGDAVHNAGRWEGEVAPLTPAALDGAAVVVDAVFGAGLGRPLEGVVAETVDAIGARGIPCVAVDVPSGVDGDTGAVRGTAVRATATVTFFRRKPGHLLLPGRLHCGDVTVADIGIPAAVLDEIAPQTFANGPELWLDAYPWPRADGHKYSRGHAVVHGGTMAGAGRLAARGALRGGAGLVTVAAPKGHAAPFVTDWASLIVRIVGSTAEFAGLIEDPRITAVLVGPGNGVNVTTRERALAALTASAATVLDADALSAFETQRQLLLEAMDGACVLTPHPGEFERLFDEIEPGADRLTRARAAAAHTGAVVLLKGADTVIAAPDGRAAINANAPPDLATAGAGDVLAGFVTALLAQGLAPFQAAGAGAWLHGAAASAFGPGLVAEDLPDALPAVLRDLRAQAATHGP